MSFFAKFDRFHELHAFIGSSAALYKAEAAIADAHTRAFNENCPRYGQTQNETYPESLASLAKTSSEQVNIE